MEKDILNTLQGKNPEPEHEEDSAEKPLIDGYVPEEEADEVGFEEEFKSLSDGESVGGEEEAVGVVAQVGGEEGAERSRGVGLGEALDRDVVGGGDEGCQPVEDDLRPSLRGREPRRRGEADGLPDE